VDGGEPSRVANGAWRRTVTSGKPQGAPEGALDRQVDFVTTQAETGQDKVDQVRSVRDLRSDGNNKKWAPWDRPIDDRSPWPVACNVAQHAFLYSGGTMTDLGTFRRINGYGTGINASGQVMGYAATSGNAAEHAFLYSNGTMADLGTLGGTDASTATAR
jgi:probable HAF family extracellular repeat protein